jgi:hypothetical protein
MWDGKITLREIMCYIYLFRAVIKQFREFSKSLSRNQKNVYIYGKLIALQYIQYTTIALKEAVKILKV